MMHKKPKRELLSHQTDASKMAIDKKVEENYVVFILTNQHQIEGLTSLIIIKTGDKITEIVLNNKDSQEIKKDSTYQTINKFFPIKPIKKKKNNNTKHQFPKLELANRNNIKTLKRINSRNKYQSH